MAGAGGYGLLSTVHAHILVVGWLSIFAWAVYYKVFRREKSLLATLHVWTAIIGVIGLTGGMWLHLVNPFDLTGPFTLIFFIVGGSILLVSFLIFLVLTFMKHEDDKA